MYSQGNSILKSMNDEINDLRNQKEDLDKDIALLSGMDEEYAWNRVRRISIGKVVVGK